MSNSGRPLSPHLSIYRWPITMTLSILHRMTGVAMALGEVRGDPHRLAVRRQADVDDLVRERVRNHIELKRYRDQLEELVNEIMIMRKLDHPYVLKLYEVYHVKREYWTARSAKSLQR